jgi:ubiquitin-protein ligase
LLNALIDLVRHPNPDDALEPDIGQLYKDINAYNKKAMEWTSKYATRK